MEPELGCGLGNSVEMGEEGGDGTMPAWENEIGAER